MSVGDAATAEGAVDTKTVASAVKPTVITNKPYVAAELTASSYCRWIAELLQHSCELQTHSPTH